MYMLNRQERFPKSEKRTAPKSYSRVKRGLASVAIGLTSLGPVAVTSPALATGKPPIVENSSGTYEAHALTKQEKALNTQAKILAINLARRATEKGPAKPYVATSNVGRNISQYITFGSNNANIKNADYVISTNSPALKNGQPDLSKLISISISFGKNNLSIYRNFDNNAMNITGSLYSATPKGKEVVVFGESINPEPGSMNDDMTSDGLHAFSTLANNIVTRAIHSQRPPASIALPSALEPAVISRNPVKN